jgi:hypothetical protein
VRQAPDNRDIVTFEVRGDSIWVVEDILRDASRLGFLVHYDGASWTELSEPEVDRPAALAATDGGHGSTRRDVATRLDGGMRFPLNPEMTGLGFAELALSAEALWVITPKQAIRYLLR